MAVRRSSSRDLFREKEEARREEKREERREEKREEKRDEAVLGDYGSHSEELRRMVLDIVRGGGEQPLVIVAAGTYCTYDLLTMCLLQLMIIKITIMVPRIITPITTRSIFGKRYFVRQILKSLALLQIVIIIVTIIMTIVIIIIITVIISRSQGLSCQ